MRSIFVRERAIVGPYVCLFATQPRCHAAVAAICQSHIASAVSLRDPSVRDHAL